MLDIIYKTNGDILGLILFLALILYFVYRNNISLKGLNVVEFVLLLSCVAGFTVDAYIVSKYVLKVEN